MVDTAGRLEIRVETLESLSLLLGPSDREDRFALCVRCGSAEDCTDSQPGKRAPPPDADAGFARRASTAAAGFARRASMAAQDFAEKSESRDMCSALATCFRHANRGDIVSWNQTLKLKITPQDLAASLRADGKESLEISVLAQRAGRLHERSLGACAMRFVHLEDKTRIFARMRSSAEHALDPAAFRASMCADGPHPAAAGVWLSLRWVPSPTASSLALHGALLRSLGGSMTNLQDESLARYRAPLGVRSFADSNERFMRCMIYVYRAQETIEDVLEWRNAERSLVVLACWCALCCGLHLLPALIPLALLYASFALSPHVPAAPYTPLSRDSFSVAEKMEYARLLQGFQVKFSDQADAIHRLCTVDLRHPRTLRLAQWVSALLFLLGCALTYLMPVLLPHVPVRLTLAVVGSAILLKGNPYVQALVAFAKVALLFRFRTAAKRREARRAALSRWQSARHSVTAVNRMSHRASVDGLSPRGRPRPMYGSTLHY